MLNFKSDFEEAKSSKSKGLGPCMSPVKIDENPEMSPVIRELKEANSQKDRLLQENREAMAELKDAFNQMTNVWKGRESEFN